MRSRPPDAAKPTGEVGFGRADETRDSERKYTSDQGVPQWVQLTSPDLVALVDAFRSQFPSVSLPPHIQRALGHQWSRA
jgi:hypothetical protein